LAHKDIAREWKKEGKALNHKRVYRLWRREGLSVAPRRVRKRIRTGRSVGELVAD
jgi:transposase InsO family protein